MAEFVMPSLGADMTAGTLVSWRKKPGDSVQRGDIIAEVETDKGIIEVEVFSSGIVEKLLVEPGTEVPVGTPLALISGAGAAQKSDLTATRDVTAPLPSMPHPPGPADSTQGTSAPPPAPTSLSASKPASPGAPVSPAARKRAHELGVDPLAVAGSGPGGRVTIRDIERAAAAVPSPAARVEPVPAAPAASPQPGLDRNARMRQAIASAMAKSKREIPHYYLSTTIDLGAAMDWLAAANANRPVVDRLLHGVLLIKAVALALREFPELNGFWKEGRSEPSRAIHIGPAISLRRGGLVAPALHDTDLKSLDQIMGDLRDLVSRARAGSLRSSELSDPTITVTSLGEQGVESVFGVIYPPQVALVGFGKIVRRAWVVNEVVTVRPTVVASLSADHRVSDGHRGALFLAAVDRLMQSPEKL